MRPSDFGLYVHNIGRINGYGGRTKFNGDSEIEAVCVFCRAKTRTVRGRYVWHNCGGFQCPASDKTPAEAARIEITVDGKIVGEPDELAELSQD